MSPAETELALAIERATLRLGRMLDAEVERAIEHAVEVLGFPLAELVLESEQLRPLLKRITWHGETICEVEAYLSPGTTMYMINARWRS